MTDTSSRQTTSLAALLAYTGRLQRERSRSKMAEHGLYRGQAWYLALLAEEDGIKQSRLASRLRMQPATVSNALQRMERDGLVERRADPADQRVSRVYLTDRGRDQVEHVRDMWLEFEQDLFQGLTDDDQANFERILIQVLANLGINHQDLERWHLASLQHSADCCCPVCDHHRSPKETR